MGNSFKSGFITIIGRPNVGKSTFINQVIGQKIVITSDKAQTTRHKIQAVYNDENSQIIFIDTPGIHKPKHQLGEYMVKTAKSTLNEVDAIIFMIDAEKGYGRGDQYIIDQLADVQTPVYLVINKIDLVQPDDLLPMIEFYNTKLSFKEIVPISALEGNNVNHLLTVLQDQLEEGPKYYPDDQLTDHPEQFIMGELIREKVLQYTREEIPHSITVVIENIAKRPADVVAVQATIVTERDSQKGIIIGKGGQMLKNIGQKAREDIERLLGSKVFLDLWVKVRKDWRNKPHELKQYGYFTDDN